jgi:dolichyl-phosphate-mannose-protein mannosyltransferase
MLVLDHALITDSRYISIDPILLFFTGATILSYTMFRRYDEQAFTTTWWSWLSVTGLNLAITISTKQSGIFLFGTIVITTLFEYYRLLGDRRVSLVMILFDYLFHY